MGIVALVNAISADVTNALSAAGLPALVDGGIVIGRVKENETQAPPRIVFTPVSSRWEAPSPAFNASAINPKNPQSPGSGIRSFTMTTYGSGYVQGSTTVTISAPDVAGGTQAQATATVTSNGAVSNVVPSVVGSGYLNPPTVTINGVGTGASATANVGPTPQALSGITNRAIKTEWIKFDVLVWGVASSGGVIAPSPNGDFDATVQLYQQVIASTQALAAGVHVVSGGTWLDADTGAAQLDLLGHAFRFTLELATPVLAQPITPTAGAAVQIAPPQTQQSPTLYLQLNSGGTPGTAQSG